MKDAKVIQFPKEKSTRKRMQDRLQEQKSVLVLSLASVLIVTAFMNQWLTRDSESSLNNAGVRGVASFEPAAFAKDVKWEQELAKSFAQEKAAVDANLAQAPTVRDELIFGLLEGKYGMRISQGRIQSLEFIDAQAGEQPLKIDDKVAFLTKYSKAFGFHFTEVGTGPSTEGEQVYTLLDSSKQIVGRAHFLTDDQGRVAAINFDL